MVRQKEERDRFRRPTDEKRYLSRGIDTAPTDGSEMRPGKCNSLNVTHVREPEKGGVGSEGAGMWSVNVSRRRFRRAPGGRWILFCRVRRFLVASFPGHDDRQPG